MVSGRRIECLSAATSLVVALVLAGPAAAATARKPRHAPAVPASREIAPDVTATIVKRLVERPADPASAPTKADDTPLPPPFRLPVASRARVRDCGLRWQAMKMSGEADDDIWRDFATRCLAAANGPLDKR